VTAVRPPIFPPSRTAPSAPQRADAGKLAAQKAFFEAALGKAPAAPAPNATPPVSPQVQASAPPAPGEAPAKILRPGSLLDIRI
jgi:hypothetical protein